MVCCKSIVPQHSLLPLDDRPQLLDLILLGEVSVHSNVPGGLRRAFVEVKFATIFPDQTLLEIDISDGLREGTVHLETRGETSTEKEVEVVTVKTEETSAHIVLDTAWDVWEDFGIRQGNISDREGRERGWSARHHLNNGRPLLTLPVMSRFLNGPLTKEKTTLLWGCISSRRKFGSVAAIDLCISYHLKWLLKLDRRNDCTGTEGTGKTTHPKKGAWQTHAS